MRTRIPHRKRMSSTIAPDDKRNFQERSLMKLIAMHLVRRQRAVPEPSQHQCVGGLSLWKIEFWHGQLVVME